MESTQTPNIWGKSAQPSETSPRSLSLPSAWRSDHQQDPEISGVTLHEEVKLITTGGLDPGISGSLETPSARKFDTIGRELQIAGFQSDALGTQAASITWPRRNEIPHSDGIRAKQQSGCSQIKRSRRPRRKQQTKLEKAKKGSQLVGFGHELVGVGRARHGRLRSAAAQPRFPRLAGSSS